MVVVADEPEQSSGDLRARAMICALGTASAIAAMYLVVSVWHRYARMNDFRSEAWPAYRALEHWHVLQFLRLSPAYVGSLVLRAPFLALAGLLGSGWRAAYFATALPCVIAAPVLGLWLSSQPRLRMGSGLASRISPIVLCAVNPIVIVCIGFGHAEDVLGASLCVAAVVLAVRGSGGWAGLLVGLAVVNKSWALVAVPVVLAVMPSGQRRALMIIVGTAASILLPVLIVRQTSLGAGGAATSLGSSTGNLFLVPQLLFWLGKRSWIVHDAHVLIVVVAFACAGAWWWLRGRRTPRTTEPTEALLLLMLVFFLRAALDPWDNLYYQTPFLFALMAYESRRPPRLTSFYSIALLLIVPPEILGGTRAFAAARYAALALPTILILGLRVYLPPERWAALRRAISPGRRRAAAAGATAAGQANTATATGP